MSLLTRVGLPQRTRALTEGGSLDPEAHMGKVARRPEDRDGSPEIAGGSEKLGDRPGGASPPGLGGREDFLTPGLQLPGR